MSEDIPEQVFDQGSRVMPSFVKAGLIKVQGGALYLKAAYRVLWMRDDHALWSIETEIAYHDPVSNLVVFKATIKDDDGKVVSTAHHEERPGKLPHWRKAETGAVARALGMAGYGTQFGDMDDDGDGNIANAVDTPIPDKRVPTGNTPPQGYTPASKPPPVRAPQLPQEPATAPEPAKMATPSQTEKLAQIYFDLGIRVDWDTELGMPFAEYKQRADAIRPEYDAYKMREKAAREDMANGK